MYKYVVAAAIRRNETITLRNVEPLHGPAWHIALPDYGGETSSAAGRGATLKAAGRLGPVMLNRGCDCSVRLPSYGHLMTAKIAYDVYRGTADRTLRLATMPGARLPAHVKRRDWVLMPTGKSPVHSDADRDIAIHGYCFFQVVDS
jgi:hypothetical protein